MNRFLAALIFLALPLTALATEGRVQTSTQVPTQGLTAKGLAKLLLSESVAMVLNNHSIEGVEIERVAGAGAKGFIVTIESAAVGPTSTGPRLRPCMVSVSALKPEGQSSANYTLTTREICVDVPPPRTGNLVTL